MHCPQCTTIMSTNRSPLPGTSLLVGELFVLLIRICMPIHVICSVMQATTLSKVNHSVTTHHISRANHSLPILCCKSW